MKKIVTFLTLFVAFLAQINAQPCLPNGIIFSSQSEIDNFQTSYPNCDIIEGDVGIEGPGITNLDGLTNITQINGYLKIIGCSDLVNLSGLSNLVSIGGYVYFDMNPLLINFTGLNNLETIGGYLEIAENNQITNLIGFESLSSIGGYLEVNSNENLINLSGLDNLVSVNEDISILFNNSLSSLSGLENISSDVTHIVLWGNHVLTDITSLHNINSISIALTIRINDILSDLTGLENIKLDSMQYLTIKKNPLLSECEIQNICNYLSINTGNIEISENATGCNNQDEVQLACISSYRDYNSIPKPEVYPNPTKNYLSIQTNGNLIMQAVLYDKVGRKILEQKNNLEKLNVSNVVSGIYILELEANNYKFRKKIIIVN